PPPPRLNTLFPPPTLGRSYQKTDVHPEPYFNIFFKDQATYPWYSDGIWFLTQMRRWGQITEEKPESWYFETAEKVYRPDIYERAAKMLIAEGKLEDTDVPFGSDGFKPASSAFIDGIEFDGRKPLEYLGKFEIGNKK
ncbi:MAG: hypothetical protein AAFN70_03510, partial [Planctomycetota bacterium]